MAVKPSQIKTRSQEYWINREEAKAKRYFRTESKQIAIKNRLYKKASSDMQKEINAFYAKYGKIMEAPIINNLGAQTGVSKKLVVDMQIASKKIGSKSDLTRLQWLQLQMQDHIQPLYAGQKEQLVDYLSDVARANYYESIYEVQRGIGVGSSFNVINDAAVSQLIRTPIKGSNFSKRYTINRDKLALNVNQILEDGIIKGVSNQDMVKELAKRVDIDRRSADRIIRTELANTYNQASLSGYEASGIVKEYEYIATLDNRTSEICQELDGQTFPIDKAMPGLNFPPTHPNCRSTTAIALDTESKEGATRIARNIKGQTYTVPASMSFKEWAKLNEIDAGR